MIISAIPILTIDVFGSLLVMVISLFALHKAKMLRKQDPLNFVYLYLVWICVGFVVFAVSRSSGHVLKQMLGLLHSHSDWVKICPFTGTINTVTFMLVGMITLFFEQSWNINIRISDSRKKLEDAHAELLDMNQNLEKKVVLRTEQLTNTEHKCRRVFEQSRDIILLTDASFYVIETNPAGLDMSGYTRDEMINRQMSLSHFFVSSAEWLRMKALILDNEFVLNEETEFIRSDGRHLAVIITGGMDYGAFGAQTTYHFIIKNIDNKKKLEKRMIQTEKLAALGELSAGLAHEINNPLGVILGYTQLMLKRKSPDVPTEFYEDLNTIKKHVLTCNSVVSDLLTFSRKDSPEMSLFDINDLVKDAIGLLLNHLDLKKIELRQDLYSQAGLMVTGNDQEIRQVIINLMINAGHAVEKNGNIELKTWKEAKKIYLQVKDNGCGIKKGDLVKIFDPFFTTKPVGQGTGLGLSVSYGIINNHSGEITVKSVPGEGTEFLVMLPAAA